MQKQSLKILWYGFFVILSLNILTWFYARDKQTRWLNVPPAPDIAEAVAFGMGDKQLAFRSFGIILQNMGDIGGRTTPLKNYDFKALADWFFLMYELDSRSNFVPYIAAYYFGGGVQDVEKLPPVIDYLRRVGKDGGEQKWRWLAQAAYLARFRLGDLDLAYEIATEVSQLDIDLPLWARNMPARVLNAQGNKAEAYGMLLEILKDNAENMHPNEVTATRAYICEQVLDLEEAKRNPMCEDILLE